PGQRRRVCRLHRGSAEPPEPRPRRSRRDLRRGLGGPRDPRDVGHAAAGRHRRGLARRRQLRAHDAHARALQDPGRHLPALAGRRAPGRGARGGRPLPFGADRAPVAGTARLRSTAPPGFHEAAPRLAAHQPVPRMVRDPGGDRLSSDGARRWRGTEPFGRRPATRYSGRDAGRLRAAAARRSAAGRAIGATQPMRRRAFLGAGTAAAGAAAAAAASAVERPKAAPGPPPSDRELWVSVARRLADPVLTHLANGTLKARMPVEQAVGSHREAVTHLEAFGRLVAGLAPWLELPPDETPEGRLRSDYAALTRRALAAAVDPSSP